MRYVWQVEPAESTDLYPIFGTLERAQRYVRGLGEGYVLTQRGGRDGNPFEWWENADPDAPLMIRRRPVR